MSEKSGWGIRLRSIGRFVRRHWILSSMAAVVLLAIVYFALRPTPRTYEYVVQPAERGDVVQHVVASGKIRALNTINVGAEVSGQITRVYVDFNAPVRAGQLLAEIDPTRVQARVQQARAQVALAQAGLAQAQAAVARAQADLATQQREYARRQTLASRDFISKAGLDQAGNALAAARAGSQTANAQVASARAQISQSQAELNAAMLDLSRTRILAPASGVVINKFVEPGTTVASSFQTPVLFEIAADTTRMQVETSVDEADIGRIREGQPVSFTVDSYPGESFEARVSQIRKSGVEAQNVVNYLVILGVDNRSGKLLSGMTANVEIVTARVRNVLRVPMAALRFRPRAGDRPDAPQPGSGGDSTGPKGASVWLATEDAYAPRRQAVVTGLQGDDFAEIRSGLKPGDKIVVRARNLPSAGPDKSGQEDDADAEARNEDGD